MSNDAALDVWKGLFTGGLDTTQETETPVEPEPALVLQIRGDIGADLHGHQKVLQLLTVAPLYLFAMQIIRFAAYSNRAAIQAARGDALGFFALFCLLSLGYMALTPGLLYWRQLHAVARRYTVSGADGIWTVFASNLSPGIVACLLGFVYYLLSLNFLASLLFYALGCAFLVNYLWRKDRVIDRAAEEIASALQQKRQGFLRGPTHA